MRSRVSIGRRRLAVTVPMMRGGYDSDGSPRLNRRILPVVTAQTSPGYVQGAFSSTMVAPSMMPSDARLPWGTSIVNRYGPAGG
ncbi:MAG: hypothetical protein QOI95_3399 [Acidimicrobiaceae bacterium]